MLRLTQASCRAVQQLSTAATKRSQTFTSSSVAIPAALAPRVSVRPQDSPVVAEQEICRLPAAPTRNMRLRTPLQAPTAAMQASHTSISLPLGPIDLFGNYSVIGPAIIRKINNALVALVQPGGAVSVLNSSSAGPTYMSCASLSHDVDDLESAVVNLAGHHLELDGAFELHDAQSPGIEHDGKLIVSPATLSEDSCILLLPGGSVSHPINVHPHKPAADARSP